MTCRHDAFPAVTITAGDDRTLRIPLTLKDGHEGGEPVLSPGDEVRAIVTAYDREIELPVTRNGDVLTVYISCEVSKSLGEMRCEGIHMCVHIFWETQGRATVNFCEDPEDIDAPVSLWVPIRIVRCHP